MGPPQWRSRITHSLIVVCLFETCRALSVAVPTPAPPANRAFVELLPYPRGSDDDDDARLDRLPTSYVATWPTYVLDLENVAATDESQESSYSWRWSRIPDESTVVETDEFETDATDGGTNGYVNPVTFDSVWHPIDLKPPHLQWAVGLHIRHGQVRHICPALDLFYPHDDDRPQHRNRGLHSVPRAFEWMEFSSFLTLDSREACRVQVATTPLLDANSAADTADTADSTVWTTVQQTPCIQTLVATAVTALATDPPNALGDGSCLVHVVLPFHRTATALRSRRVRVVLDNEMVHDTCRGRVGTLDVTVESTAAGSESAHRPACYNALFTDASLQRPAFVAARRRLRTATTADALTSPTNELASNELE